MIALATDTPHAVTQTGIHPLEDIEFCYEKPGAHKEVLELWGVCEAIHNAPRTLEAISTYAAHIGLSVSKLKRLYYDWKGVSPSGIRYDWEVLVNRSKYPKPKLANLPPAFVTFWMSLIEDHQRKNTIEQARRILMGMLSRWERDPANPEYAIPGYAHPPKRLATQGHPAGWSQRNLSRFKPNKFEQALRKQGPKHASNYFPKLYTTRVGLHFGEIIYFDDQLFDTYVNLTGRNGQAMRPLSFAAMEALSGSCFEMAFKPQLDNGRDAPRTELSQLDFFWFVMHVLMKHGYSRKGTILVMEHGTANVDKVGVFDELIHRATGGCVTVDRSGLFRKPAFKAMIYEGRSSGNFRFKAPIESFFNLIRNWHSALPGATGLNPAMSPEENHGLIAYNNRRLKLIDQLPMEQFLRLKSDVLEWEDFTRVAMAINRAIDFDPGHDLEGWEKLKFFRRKYRLALDSEQWMDEAQLEAIPPDARAALQHIFAQKGFHRDFRMSRGEVFAAHAHELTRLPMHQIPLLAPKRAWREVTVSRDLEISIRDQYIDSEPLIYHGKVVNSTQHEVYLKRGETYNALINANDPNYIWIAERSGTILGMAKRFVAPIKVDHEAIIEHLGEINHMRANESKEVHARMETTAAVRQRLIEHNRMVLAKKTSEESVDLTRKAARMGRKIAKVSTPAPAPTEPPSGPVEDWSTSPTTSTEEISNPIEETW